MRKNYRPYLPEQKLLLPPSLQDWLPENNLAGFVSDVADQLRLSAIESVHEKEQRGQPPYHPRLMVHGRFSKLLFAVRAARSCSPAAFEPPARTLR